MLGIAAVLIAGFVYTMIQSQTDTNQQEIAQDQDRQGIGGSGIQPDLSDQSEVKTFEISGVPFEFSMQEIRVRQGDRVRIIFTNNEGMHDWGVDEFNARTKQLQTGESDTVEFVADKKGTFEYYCSVNNHRQMGMVGNLIVD